MDIKLDYSGSELGKYYLIEKLGNGGFGAVYKAKDRILQAEKAVKILEVTDPNKAFLLFNEAAIPYKCKHNHIININGGEIINFNSELLFVVDMDLANGASIDSILRNSHISVIDSLNIIKAILFAVEYSHLQGITHRDIKPANILMDNGVPKLSDFGLSAALGSLIIPWKWYRTHAAPETFVNNSIATIQTDIFALGMTLYRMANSISDWKLLLQGIPNAEKHIMSGKLIDKLPFVTFVPQQVRKIIKKACRATPNDRYQSASEMRNALERLRHHYNWIIIGKDHWTGSSIGHPTKEIFLNPRRKSIDVIVLNNGRKSASDSGSYDNIFDAQQYLFEYMKRTTFQ